MSHQSINIIIDNSLHEFASWLTALKPNQQAFVLMDDNTAKHCLPYLQGTSARLKDAISIILPAGEQHKTLEGLGKIIEELSKNKADRNSVLICLGGGVICDIGGFAASTYKRGIKFALVPTTILAQLDAAIGGKTGIDFLEHKNLVGTIAFPEAIFISSIFHATLTVNEKLNGIAEAFKHSLISNQKYWNEIKQDPLKNVDSLIIQSIQIKKSIVEQDPFEKNIRKLLNAGHTIGHAIESCFLKNSQPIPHGRAVAAGLIIESKISQLMGYLSGEEVEDITHHVTLHFGKLPIENISENDILEFMENDKKNTSGNISFSLIRKIGEATYDDIVSKSIILEAINHYHPSKH